MPHSIVDQVTLRRRGTGVIAHDPQLAGEGFTLIAPQTDGGRVYLVGMKGEIAHQWKVPCRPGRHAVLLPNGNVGYNGNLPGQPDIYPAWALWHGGAFFEVTPSGKIVWEYSDPMHHHDGQWLPNGNLLYGAMEPMPKEYAARVKGGNRTHDLPEGTIYADVIKEVNREGEIVWQWRSWENLRIEDFPIHETFDRYHWPLINGVWLTRGNLVLMSLRTTSGIIAIDKATSKLAWQIPYPIACQQHTPVELEGGNILLFDNGNLRPGFAQPWSRVIEFDPRTEAIAWEYSDRLKPAFFSPYMGGAQRLPNGNTHITESATGRLFDVTPEGEVVWEYVIPFFAEYPDEEARKYSPGLHNSVFRSYRYHPTQIAWL
jgi:Arylsulfotransferase (ASST)